MENAYPYLLNIHTYGTQYLRMYIHIYIHTYVCTFPGSQAIGIDDPFPLAKKNK